MLFDEKAGHEVSGWLWRFPDTVVVNGLGCFDEVSVGTGMRTMHRWWKSELKTRRNMPTAKNQYPTSKNKETIDNEQQEEKFFNVQAKSVTVRLHSARFLAKRHWFVQTSGLVFGAFARLFADYKESGLSETVQETIFHVCGTILF